MLGRLFPDVCAGCGRSGAVLCPECASDLRPAPAATPPAGLDAWYAAFAYEGVARELVARVKYRNTRAAVPWLGTAMVDALPPGAACDVVTWAPTVAARRRDRGFDPAELLARCVARQLRLPVGRFLRRRPGPAQTGLDAASRRTGPRFDPLRRPPGSVLVVDDVATTGATLGASAGALRLGGARIVVGLTASRTPAPGSGYEVGRGSQGRAS